MKFFVILFFLTLCSILSASTRLGVVESFVGNVKVKSDESIKKSRVFVGLEIKEGDLITTAKKANAKIKLLDGSILILDASSLLHFTSGSDVEQEGGKIFYKIISRNSKNALKIKTPFAIIGIKGTTFIISAGKDSSVTLKEGLIEVSSIKEEFELYRQKIKAEFNDYKFKQEKEYEKYLNAQNSYENVKKTRKFDLREKYSVSFVGTRVNEKIWSTKDNTEFKYFEQLSNNRK